MACPCATAQCVNGVAVHTLLALLLFGHVSPIAVADTRAPGGAGFDCRRGCPLVFEPVCGEDGQTYSNACVASCQDVRVARAGSCPGEPLLHLDNQHVVTGGRPPGEGEGQQGPPPASPSSPPSSSSSAAAAAAAAAERPRLTQHHLDAFRHEGFRYAGQMRFTEGAPHKPGHHARQQELQQQQQQQQQQRAQQGLGLGPGVSALDQLQQQQGSGGLRAVRVTRAGHIYVADMEENVDRVLDTLIRHQEAADEAAAAAAAAASGEEEQYQQEAPQQQQQQQGPASWHPEHHEQAQALLHSLQRWRDYGARGGGSGGGDGGMGGHSKWARHTIITATSGPADHALQPVLLDVAGAAAGFAAQGPAGPAPSSSSSSSSSDTTTTTTSPATSKTVDADSTGGRQQQQQRQSPNQQRSEQQQGEGEGSPGGLSWTTRVLGGFWSDRRERRGKQQQQQKRAGGQAEGGGGGMEVHRPVRRSLGVFETDDRIDCPRTPTYPFTAIGQINVRDTSGNYVCSGTLVGPDVVLTAAHCVYNRAAQAFYERLDFAPSRYRTLEGLVVNPFGVVPWSYVTVYQGYSSLSSPDPNTQDIAVITLSQRIGSQAGWMGVFEPCSPYAPSRYVALTAGYPSDQAAGSCKATQCVVVQDPCTDGYLYHKCDTASGQSGSPMYMMAMTAGKKMGPYIRGVHNIEWVQEMPGGTVMSYINSAVSITPDHYRSILAWIGLSFTTNGTTPMGPALPPTNYMSQLSATAT